jgi:glycine oxidase
MPQSAVVIGAGVIGATAAWELAASGVSVRVIDARRPGHGATRASAGVLAPYIEGHPSSPLRDLGRQSLDLYDEFITRLRRESGHDVAYERNGTLEIALTLEEAEALAAASGALWSESVEARWVPREVVEDLEPHASREAYGALMIPMHGYVGATAMTLAAVAAATSLGAEVIVETGAIEVLPLPGGRVRVAAASSSWDADVVVMAAGSWSSQIRVAGADPLPVTPVRGQLLHLQAPDISLRHIVWGKAGYLVPWRDGTILVGGTVEEAGFDENPTERARRELKAVAAGLVPALAEAEILETRVGLRPRMADDLPAIGRSTVVPGLIYATGHYRNGILLAPLTARLVNTLAADPNAPTIAAADPSRCGKV